MRENFSETFSEKKVDAQNRGSVRSRLRLWRRPRPRRRSDGAATPLAGAAWSGMQARPAAPRDYPARSGQLLEQGGPRDSMAERGLRQARARPLLGNGDAAVLRQLQAPPELLQGGGAARGWECARSLPLTCVRRSEETGAWHRQLGAAALWWYWWVRRLCLRVSSLCASGCVCECGGCAWGDIPALQGWWSGGGGPAAAIKLLVTTKAA